MISIEIKRIIKEGGVIFLVLVALLAALLVTNLDIYLAPAFEIFLLLYASFTGWSMFERERDEGAMEFMLQLPVSRSKLFLMKFFPRTAAVLLILVFYHLVRHFFDFPFLLPAFTFTLFYAAVFLVSLAFSLSMKNFIATFFLALFLSVGLFYLVKILDRSRPEAVMATQAALSLLVFPLLFFILFKKFDIRPISTFNKKFVPALVVLIILVFGITYFTTGSTWSYCYLTEEGRAMRISPKKTVLIEKNGDVTTLSASVTPLLEDNGKIYAVKLQKGRHYPHHLVRLDLQSLQIEDLFQAETGWWFHTGPVGKLGAKLENGFYFLLTDRHHQKYRVLEVKGSRTRAIPVKADFGEEAIHFIGHVGKDPLQFIVFTGSTVYRVFEDGETERLFAAQRIAAWKNRLLVFSDSGMTLYEMGETLRPVFQETGQVKKVRRRFGNYISRKVLIKIDNVYYAFDMEQGTLESIPLRSLPYYYLPSTQGLRIVWVKGDEITVSELKDRRITTEKIWYTTLEGLKISMVFSSGVVVYNRRNYEVYRFEEDNQDQNPTPQLKAGESKTRKP